MRNPVFFFHQIQLFHRNRKHYIQFVDFVFSGLTIGGGMLTPAFPVILRFKILFAFQIKIGCSNLLTGGKNIVIIIRLHVLICVGAQHIRKKQL